ncbi:MAG: FAD-dependent oxidoreductase, partial [Actinocatenispora sp.]
PVVVCDGREITARHVVVAAGAWLPRLAPALARHCTVTRRVMGWFRPHRPDEYGTARFPVFLRNDRSGLRTWYGCPALDRGTVKVALHAGPSLTETVDPDERPRPGDAADAAALAEVVADTLPGLDPQPVDLVSCMYTVTPDEHFLIGGRPDLPGLTLLGGFSGHGFKFASAVGEIAAELATTGRTSLPVDMFAPDRFDP